MSEFCSGRSEARVIHHDSRGETAAGIAVWLSLAAMPTFAIMALVTAATGGGASDPICSSAHVASPLGGMVPMYLLMSAFHTAPWLRLISQRRRHATFADPAFAGSRRGSPAKQHRPARPGAASL